jgi:hypothetical protein
MTERYRGDEKEIRKDQQARRETAQEIGAEIQQDHMSPIQRHPNRDQARGDWDRSRRHTDEGRSRDDRAPGDDGLGPPE